MTSKLLIHSHAPDARGSVVHVTPESAGWQFVGFEAQQLAPSDIAFGRSDTNELCLVLIRGRARIEVDGQDLGVLGARLSPFDAPPWSVYLPPGKSWQVTAQDDVELGICASPAEGKYGVRVIPPEEAGQIERGTGSNLRLVRNILPDTAPAETLLVVEVVTPGGHWSSYPPHKHDTDDFPNETYLEETYYHRLKRGSGFAVQRVYTKDGSLDETMAIADGDVVLVPRGYHPVGAPAGFDLYYLNVMAGPVRQWKFSMDPDHAHIPY